MLEGLFGTANFLSASLDGLTDRGNAIADNLANVDTPNYKAHRVEFESQLQEIEQKMAGGGELDLAVSDPRHFTLGPSSLANFRPTQWTANSTSVRNDGNNVDIDSEMTVLAETEISYSTVADLAKRQFARLKGVISG